MFNFAQVFQQDEMNEVKLMFDVAYQVFGYTEEQLKGLGRGHLLCFARYCIYEKMGAMGLSLSKIGWCFNRDHATILHGRQVLREARTNATFKLENMMCEKFNEEYEKQKGNGRE